MKKNICFYLILFFSISCVKAQITFSGSDGSKKETVQRALDYSIKNADNLIEGSYISFESYFVEAENQGYDVILVKVKKIIKGENISLNDTIAIVGKKRYKGTREVIISDDQPSSPLWGDKNSVATLFLKKSSYTEADKIKLFSKYNQLQTVDTEIGSFSARYDSEYFADRTQAVYIEGLQFKTKQSWYDYLKQFLIIKVPEEK